MGEKQVLTGTGLDATASAGTEYPLGFIQVHRYGGSIEVVEVVAQQRGASDAYWNITVGGNNIFSTSQTVTASNRPQIFYPDQNKYAAASALLVSLVMKSSSATSGSKLDVSVLVRRV